MTSLPACARAASASSWPKRASLRNAAKWTPQAALIGTWMLRTDHESSRPIADAFVHTSDLHRGCVEQVPVVAAGARGRALHGMARLDRELADRACIAGADDRLVDIVAQCALLPGKAAALLVSLDMTNLAHRFAAVSVRPSARAGPGVVWLGATPPPSRRTPIPICRLRK